MQFLIFLKVNLPGFIYLSVYHRKLVYITVINCSFTTIIVHYKIPSRNHLFRKRDVVSYELWFGMPNTRLFVMQSKVSKCLVGSNT